MQSVLDALFAPIARLLVGRGMLFPQAAERLKRAYLAAGQERAQTDSALSVLTGLQRRDIARLRDMPETAETPRLNHLSRLVALWQTDPAYRGRDLDRRGQGSFEDLAQSIRRDVHPRTMLDALVDAGTVTITPKDRIRLVATSYQPLPGSEAQLDYLARNGSDFLSASVDNVLASGLPHFERAVHYNGLSAEAVQILRDSFADRQMALLEAMNDQAAQLQRDAPGTMRFRAGGYFYDRKDEA